MKPFDLKKQATAKAAVTGFRAGTKFIAGGTNLVDLMKKNIEQPDQLFDVVDALPSGIEMLSNGIRIGAMARNSAVAENPAIQENYSLLSKAILKGASPQIRNMASVAGNLLQRTRCPYFYDITAPCNKRKPGAGCSAIKGDNRMAALFGASEKCVAVHPSDMCVALAALDATVHYIDGNQKTGIIAFKDFHTLPGTKPNIDNTLPAGALITAVEIPENKFGKNNFYLKLRDRESYAFALVSVAAALELDGDVIRSARLASGGVAHKPWRWYDAENFLQGKKAGKETFAMAAALATNGARPLADNGFKVQMLAGAIELALQNCLTI